MPEVTQGVAAKEAVIHQRDPSEVIRKAKFAVIGPSARPSVSRAAWVGSMMPGSGSMMPREVAV